MRNTTIRRGIENVGDEHKIRRRRERKKNIGYTSDASEQGNRGSEVRLQNETIKATRYGRKEKEDLRQ